MNIKGIISDSDYKTSGKFSMLVTCQDRKTYDSLRGVSAPFKRYFPEELSVSFGANSTTRLDEIADDIADLGFSGIKFKSLS